MNLKTLKSEREIIVKTLDKLLCDKYENARNNVVNIDLVKRIADLELSLSFLDSQIERAS